MGLRRKRDGGVRERIIQQFPHCDSRILHAPGECEYCDAHPEWQELRESWGICFTGHDPQPPQYEWQKQLPCPADFNRGDGHTRWGGNTAKPPGGVTLGYDGIGYEVRVTKEEYERLSEETRNLLLDLQSRLAAGS